MLYPRIEKVQSEAEKRFLEDCVTVGLKVEPQYTIGNIHPDFAIPSRKIVIEIDSKEFHSGEVARKNDELRDEYYNKRGWNVIRIRAVAVLNRGEGIAEEIKEGVYGNTRWCLVWN